MSAQLSLTFEAPQILTRVDWFAVAMSDDVAQRLLAVAKQRASEWLQFRDFYPLASELNIRANVGHSLFHLAISGRLEQREIYFGSRNPGDADYRGFAHEYRYVEDIQ